MHDSNVVERNVTAELKATSSGVAATAPATQPEAHKRFTAPENLLGVLFLGVFAFNLLIMALDFPRTTALANAYLQSGADRKAYQSTVALAACRCGTSPSVQAICQTMMMASGTTH